MKKNKKNISVFIVLAAVCLATALTYFCVKGSMAHQAAATTVKAEQGSETHISETKDGGDKKETEKDNGGKKEGSTQYVVVTQPESTTKQPTTAPKQENAVPKPEDIAASKISFTNKNSDPLSSPVDFDSITAKYGPVIAAVEKGYKSLQTTIDLSDFGITYDELHNVVKYLSINHGYYYVKSAYDYSTLGNNVLEYNPSYFWNAEEIKDIDSKIEAEVSRIAAEAKDLKTDLEKFIYIHNSLILNISYGAEDVDRDNNLYGAFVLKNTLCTGYSEAFCQIAARLGLKAWVVTSDKLGHAWNLVLLDGRYYFVDCAWDDPVISDPSLIDNPVSGYGQYRYFMCSQEYLYKSNHESKDWAVNGISALGLAESRFYDNFFWRDYEILMKPSLGSWYQNYSFEVEGAKAEQVKFSIDKIVFLNNENYTIELNRTIYSCWRFGSSYYPIFYSTLQSYNGSVYYIKANGIYKINEGGSVDGSNDACVFKNPRNDNIYDFYIDKAEKTFTVVYGKTMDNTASNATRITYKMADYGF